MFEKTLSDSIKLAIALSASLFLGLSFIMNNTGVYLITSVVAVVFMSAIVALRPYLFMSIFLSLSYPVSLTIGKLEIDNLGIAFLIVITLLAIAILIKRSGFAIEKKRLTLFLPFVPVILVVIFSSIYGFIRSGNDSLEILVKFFVFGVFPAALMMVVPYTKDVLLEIMDLTYYLLLAIFGGFTIAFCYFKFFNPAFFVEFFLGFDNPIGTSLFMMQFIMISMFFMTVHNVSNTTKTFMYNNIFIAIFIVVSGFQRSFLVAILFAVFYFVVTSYKIGLKVLVLGAILISIFAGVIYNIQTVLDPDKMYKFDKTIEFAEKLSENKDILRIEEAEELGTIGYRIIKIIAAVKKIKQNPYFGNGLGTFSNYAGYKYPHNILIELIYSSGFIGFAVVVFFLLKIFLSIHLKIPIINKTPYGKIMRISISFSVLCFIILQFSGGVMNIFPYLFFMLYMQTVFSQTGVYTK